MLFSVLGRVTGNVGPSLAEGPSGESPFLLEPRSNRFLDTSRSSPLSSVGGGARVLLEQVLCLPVGWKELFMKCRTFSCRRSPRRVSIPSWGHAINNRRIVPVLTKFSCLNTSLLYSSSRRMERSFQEMLDFLLERWTSSYCTSCTAFQPHPQTQQTQYVTFYSSMTPMTLGLGRFRSV